MTQLICPKCGAVVSGGDKICSYCGTHADEAPTQQESIGQQPNLDKEQQTYSGQRQQSNSGQGQHHYTGQEQQAYSGQGQQNYSGQGQQAYTGQGQFQNDFQFNPGAGGYPPTGNQGFGYPPPPQYGGYSQPYYGRDNGFVSTASYLGHYLLYSIPIIGIIIAIVQMNDASRPVDFRNFAKAMFILCIIGLVLNIICISFLYSTFTSYYRYLF
ncbi:MAG: zinc-ribbon domain-containing protein [Clostridiales Family XIII bacterium]|jgi:hypothetical protein|nr:zinc-ribbon domain-containing protein [Clostridiales Family XIII bacterium]